MQTGYQKALHFLLDTLSILSVDWALTGSMGMLLQGMNKQPADIDVQTDRKGAYLIDQSLADYCIQPVRYLESEKMRSYIGSFQYQGMKIEVMGDIQKLLPYGSWESPVDIKAHRIWVDWKGEKVPVLSLEYEIQAYRKMGRLEKALEMEIFLKQNSSHSSMG